MGTTGEISTDNMKIKLENLKQDYKKFQKQRRYIYYKNFRRVKTW